MCLIPFAFINLQNSPKVNCEPLSLTSCCGMPYRANISRRFAIVASIVMLGIISTSNHFEWLSTTVRNILPINGPAKSMCTLYHGIFCHPTGVRVPVGACYVTSDSCRISLRLWPYLCQD